MPALQLNQHVNLPILQLSYVPYYIADVSSLRGDAINKSHHACAHKRTDAVRNFSM
jgi:hypothetical protein